MRLKQLHMQGYKSFASRTEFVFPTGITAIVGPNGSGKSNIADAIRWALGEQSMRALRGKITADMIFSGGARRARAGMAEVQLTLDNTGGWLPVDFSEVTIGRRAYRSGESEYLLNNNRVRLRDINDLLAESGLSQRTYTVIGQGLVDTALSLRPQERRALFEEAAGIAVYRSRREEAAGRLEETERNLERVRDIMGEIAPRLKRLEEQASRFEEHERITTHLKQLQRAWYGYHWGQAQEALRAARERAESLEEALAARQEEAETAAARLMELRRQQTTLRGRLRDWYRRVADLHDQADVVQRELAALSERARQLAVRQQEVEEEVEPLLAQRAAQAQEVQATREQETEREDQVRTHEERVAALERELVELRRLVEERTGRRAEILTQLERLRVRREELDTEVAEARAAQSRLEAEQELLAQLREESAGFAQGTRALLQAGLPGLEGVLSGLIHVPAEWERAIEAALGPRVQTLVVQDWAAVTAARAILSPDERAVLLPLKGLEPHPWEPPPGWLRASDVVTCTPSLRPAVESLLGRTVLVEDGEAARSMRTQLPPAGRCVTRSGEVVAADGTVRMGSGGGLLAQERTWRELPDRLAAARRRREELEAELTRITEGVRTLEAARQEADQGAEEAAARLAEAEAGPLTQARTDLAVARQALDNHRRMMERELAALQQIEGRVASHRQRREELAAQRVAAEEQLTQLEEQSRRFKEELAQVRSGIGPAEEKLNRLGQEQEQAEGKERRLRSQVRQWEERVNKARLEVARAEDRLRHLQERIQEELGLVELEVADEVTSQTLLPLRPLVSRLPIVEVLPEGLQEEIQWLKSRLQRIGPVNPNAPQDYAETSDRHQFLSEQVADLEAASDRLQEVIADLDRMMEEAFQETFEAVAQAFEEIFARLFNGGAAHLELAGEGDLTEIGVEIVARPPGKRTERLALLSGGERALTAVALIFAILRVSPTPFCVLDEVDAMLDESNILRFRALLEELSRETQFILITHNRGTVEAADTVYGISMGSEGVSQVVSLRLERAQSEVEVAK